MIFKFTKISFILGLIFLSQNCGFQEEEKEDSLERQVTGMRVVGLPPLERYEVIDKLRSLNLPKENAQIYRFEVLQNSDSMILHIPEESNPKVEKWVLRHEIDEEVELTGLEGSTVDLFDLGIAPDLFINSIVYAIGDEGEPIAAFLMINDPKILEDSRIKDYPRAPEYKEKDEES